MTLVRTLIAVLFFATLFAASNAWTRAAAHRNAAVLDPALASRTTSVLDGRARELHNDADDWTEPRIDLNGNEVDAAVGDYRVDTRGEMYELHAPDTALLHLSAPRM
jgi:hypothetical protein